MTARLLESGDRVVHPTFGFGVVEAVTSRERAGLTTNYYNIRLDAVRVSDGGLLSVPVDRANELGLRLVGNTLAMIVDCLRSAARPLPDDGRQREMELTARWQTSQPLALVKILRDVISHSHVRGLTAGDRRWLANARERLITEAALVDGVDVAEARTTIQNEIDALKPGKRA